MRVYVMLKIFVSFLIVALLAGCDENPGSSDEVKVGFYILTGRVLVNDSVVVGLKVNATCASELEGVFGGNGFTDASGVYLISFDNMKEQYDEGASYSLRVYNPDGGFYPGKKTGVIHLDQTVSHDFYIYTVQ